MIQLETNLEESNRERIWGLDLYRSIAIILVVFTHGAYLLEKTPFEGFPFIKMLDGVDLFFVLSGFLIGGILLKDITSTSGIGFKKLFNFWKRRWLRTLPNYYLILLINYLFIKNKIIIENITQFNWKFLFFYKTSVSRFAVSFGNLGAYQLKNGSI